MVAERAIVRVLLDSHYLNSIVAVGMDARHHQVAEFNIGANPFTLLSHAYVALIYKEWLCIGLEPLHFPAVGLRHPHLSREKMGVFILHNPGCIRGNPLPFSTFPTDNHFVVLTVVQCLGGQLQLPDSVIGKAGQSVPHLLLPVAEITDKGDFRSIGRPFTEHPASIFRAVKTEIIMCVSEIVKRTGLSGKLSLFLYRVLVATQNCRCKRREPRVILDKIQSFLCLRHSKAMVMMLFWGNRHRLPFPQIYRKNLSLAHFNTENK